jgi:xanthine dehydrogenase/oxidase
MGLGLWTSEQVRYEASGRLATGRTWSYHVPGACDVPADFRVNFRRNAPNPVGVLRSKGTIHSPFTALTLFGVECVRVVDATFKIS